MKQTRPPLSNNIHAFAHELRQAMESFAEGFLADKLKGFSRENYETPPTKVIPLVEAISLHPLYKAALSGTRSLGIAIFVFLLAETIVWYEIFENVIEIGDIGITAPFLDGEPFYLALSILAAIITYGLAEVVQVFMKPYMKRWLDTRTEHGKRPILVLLICTTVLVLTIAAVLGFLNGHTLQENRWMDQYTRLHAERSALEEQLFLLSMDPAADVSSTQKAFEQVDAKLKSVETKLEEPAPIKIILIYAAFILIPVVSIWASGLLKAARKVLKPIAEARQKIQKLERQEAFLREELEKSIGAYETLLSLRNQIILGFGRRKFCELHMVRPSDPDGIFRDFSAPRHTFTPGQTPPPAA